MNPKSILVTGVAGFIGSNFVKKFKSQFSDTKIVGIDNFSTGRKSALDKDIIFYEGTIVDFELLDEIFKAHEPEYVFHFAAIPRVSYSLEHPYETTVANISGTVALLEKSREYKVKRFIYSSSSAVYGGAKVLPTKENENNPAPISPYALQKYVGEPYCTMFSNLFGLDTVSLRYFNVFGPGQYGDSPYSTVISAWLESLYFGDKKPFLEGDGGQSRDFCFVDNAVQANICAMLKEEDLNGEVFNIAHGERTDLLNVKELIEKHTGKKLDLEMRPERLGDVKDTHADISKARDILGYDPVTNFETCLKKTIEWFDSRKAGNNI